MSYPASDEPSTPSLLELGLVFARLGAIGFGGPAAHVALMREELVRRRQWLTDEALLDLVAASNLIPGPNSTEVALHVGWRMHRIAGLAVAGISFIAPAFLSVLAIAVAYRAWGRTPDVAWLLSGVTPVVLAVVLDALVQFGRSAVRRPSDLLLVAIAGTAAAAGLHELAILTAAAVVALIRTARGLGGARPAVLVAPMMACAGGATVAGAAAAAATGPAIPVTLGSLGLFFLKVGATLFGSGYVLLAFLRADLVERWHWLTPGQLLDAIAVGQFTPGPLFTTATFVGYLLAGVPGAVVATVAIFAPAFAFVACTAPWLARLRASRRLSAILDHVVLASLGLMAMVALLLARDALAGPASVLLCVVALSLLLWRRPNSAWLVVGGGLAGWLAHRL